MLFLPVFLCHIFVMLYFGVMSPIEGRWFLSVDSKLLDQKVLVSFMDDFDPGVRSRQLRIIDYNYILVSAFSLLIVTSPFSFLQS